MRFELIRHPKDRRFSRPVPLPKLYRLTPPVNSLFGGETGIRTRGPRRVTAFPRQRDRPLCHLTNLIVPRPGLEPGRPCGHKPLKLARLPVPPPRHINEKSPIVRLSFVVVVCNIIYIIQPFSHSSTGSPD